MSRSVHPQGADIAELITTMQRVADSLVGESEGEGSTEGQHAFRGPNSTSIKHLAQSVKDGRLVSFYHPDLDEITGYVTGWDDLRQPCPRVFVVVPPPAAHPERGVERWLVPFYNTAVRLHDESTAPRKEGDPFYDKYEEIVRPFKTYVLNNYFGKKKNKGEATPMRRAAS